MRPFFFPRSGTETHELRGHSSAGLSLLTSSAFAQSDTTEPLPVLNVVTTTGMVKDMVVNIGGDRVAVEAIMKEGVDPHLYQPTAADVRKVLAADLVFANGLNLEDA